MRQYPPSTRDKVAAAAAQQTAPVAHVDTAASDTVREGATWQLTAGALCMANEETKAQARLNTSVPLVPPKPKLFLTATSILRSRASLAQ